MTAVYPETGADWEPWADFDAFETLLAAEPDPVGPMFAVNVDGVPMVPAHLVVAALDVVADTIADYRRRDHDLTVGLGTRLVDVHADAMGEALDLIRGVLAETPEDRAPRTSRLRRRWVTLRQHCGCP